jgi:hypothetical protein
MVLLTSCHRSKYPAGLSAGCEDFEDVWSDLEAALAAA